MSAPEIVYAIRFWPTSYRSSRLYEARSSVTHAVSRRLKNSWRRKEADNYEVVEYELVEKRTVPLTEWKKIKQIQAEERQARRAAKARGEKC